MKLPETIALPWAVVSGLLLLDRTGTSAGAQHEGTLKRARLERTVPRGRRRLPCCVPGDGPRRHRFAFPDNHPRANHPAVPHP